MIRNREGATFDCPEDGCDGKLVQRNDSKFGHPWWYACEHYPECRGSCCAKPDGSLQGIPANQETRRARSQAHKHFDKLWRLKFVKRGLAYKALSAHFGYEVHMSESDLETCKEIVRWSIKKLAIVRSGNDPFEAELGKVDDAQTTEV